MNDGCLAPVFSFERRDVDCNLDIDLDTKLAERLSMPNNGVPGQKNCNCESTTRAVIQTVWSGGNKGRCVMTCPKENVKGCNFKVWLDGPFSLQARKVIDHMYHIIEQLEFENVVGLGMKNLNWVDYIEERGVHTSSDTDVSGSS